MASINTAVQPDKESVYYQGSLAQMQSRQFSNINRDNITFMEIIKNEPRKQSYTDTTEFDTRLSKFTFLPNKIIYKKVIDDARVIPEDIIIKNRMDEYFSPRFYKNIQRLYQNAPAYFDYIFSRDGIAEQRHKQYSVYIYTLCLIEYSIKYYNTQEFKLIKGYQLYYDWALPKYSEHISYIIKGPLSKSSNIKIDFKKHYSTIMNPSNTEGDITQTLQLASLQNLDSKLTLLSKFIEMQPNSFNKVKDDARVYTLSVSALRVKYYNEPTLNNTIVVDLRGSDFGDVGTAIAKTPKLDSTIEFGADITSRLSIHKLQELLNDYTRIRVPSFYVDASLYKVPLDWYTEVQLYIKGIQLASRAVSVHDKGKNIEDNGLTIPGSFTLDPVKQLYKFTPSIDVTTYDNRKVRVTDARIYLAYNGNPLQAAMIQTNITPMNTFNVKYICNSSSMSIVQGSTLYTFSNYHAQNYIYTLPEGLVDVGGNLLYMHRAPEVGINLLNTRVNTYALNRFIVQSIHIVVTGDLVNRTVEKHKINILDTSSKRAFLEALIGGDVITDYSTRLTEPLFIEQGNGNGDPGYVYSHSAELTERLWNISDYYRSLLAIYDPVTDIVFKRDRLTPDNGSVSTGSLVGSIFALIIHDTVTNENAFYSYNFSINGCDGITATINGDNSVLTISGDINEGDDSTTLPSVQFDITTNSVITILATNVYPPAITDLRSLRIAYFTEEFDVVEKFSEDDEKEENDTETGNTGTGTTTPDSFDAGWYAGPCLMHIPPIDKIGFVFSESMTPWLDLKLHTLSVDRLIIQYTINYAIPMLSIYKYTVPKMIINETVVNKDSSKLLNIIDDNGVIVYKGIGFDAWRSISILETTYFMELDLRKNYFATYDYYHAFELALEFS